MPFLILGSVTALIKYDLACEPCLIGISVTGIRDKTNSFSCLTNSCVRGFLFERRRASVRETNKANK
jgi:hypothetical protein